MENLEKIIRRLIDSKVAGELWVNGSFLTSKIDPEDADVTLRILHHVYDNGTDEQRKAIDWFRSNLHDSHKCDTYVLTQYPKEHKDYWVGEYAYAYWLRQWGFSRGNEQKGIAVIELASGLV